MRKVIFIFSLVMCSVAVSAQTTNPFPTTDSLRKFINKWIRNSAVDAFTNLRLNTALIGVTRFIDSSDANGKLSISDTAAMLAGYTRLSRFMDSVAALRSAIAGAGAGPGGPENSLQYRSGGIFAGDAGLIYNAVTNTLTTDTAALIKSRQSMAQFNRTVNVRFDNIASAGHSIMQGSNAVPMADSSFIARTGYYLNSEVRNYAISGTGSATAAYQLLGNVNPGHRSLVTFMMALNDTRRANITVAGGRRTINKNINSAKSIWVNTVARSVVDAGGSGVTRYGTWTTGQNMRTDAGKSSNGAFTTAQNDSLVYTATDSTFYVILNGRDGSGSTYVGTTVEVYVDNVLNQTVNTDLQADGISDGGPTNSKGIPMAIVIRGLSYGSHSIKVVKSGAGGYMYVDVVGTIQPAGVAMPLMYFHDPYMNSTGYAVPPNLSSDAAIDLINSKFDSLFTSATFAGYPVLKVATNSTYNIATGLDVDGIHPNNRGHFQIFSGDSSLFNVPTFQGIPNMTIVGGDNGFWANVNGRNERLIQRSYVDSVKKYSYQQNGNSFGTTAVLGTQDNQPISFIVNNVQAGRIFPQYNNWVIGNINTDPGFGNKLQVDGSIVLTDANNRGVSMAGEWMFRKASTTTRYLFGAGPPSGAAATHVYGIGPGTLSNINTSANDVYGWGNNALLNCSSCSFTIGIGGFNFQNATTITGGTSIGRSGFGAATTANYLTGLGFGHGNGITTGSNNIQITAHGQIGGVPATLTRSIALTIGASGWTNNQSRLRSNMFYAGGGGLDSMDVVFDPADVSHDSTANPKVRAYISGGFGFGTNSIARDLHLSSGLSTGNATGAGISFWASNPGSSGTALQGRSLLGRMDGGGIFTWNGRLRLPGSQDSTTSATGGFVYRDAATGEYKLTAAPSGGTPSLTQNYIGVGNGSNQLSGSTAYQFNGATVTQEASGAANSIISTTAVGASSGGAIRLLAKATPTAADQLMGAVQFGTLDGGSTENITASIRAYANGAHTPGSSEPTNLRFYTSAAATESEVMRLTHNLRVGIGVTSPTARLHLPAGNASAQNAPLKFSSGTNMTTPEAGAEEYDGTSRFFTPGSTRLRYTLTDNSIPSNGQIPIGNGTNYTNATLTSGTGVSVTNGAGSITVALNSSYIAAGDYTPTLTGVTNVDAVTLIAAHYIRVGDQVTVDIAVNVDPTLSATLTNFDITLPIASTMTNATNLTGIITSGTGGTGNTIAFSNNARTGFEAMTTSSQVFNIHFMYRIQ